MKNFKLQIANFKFKKFQMLKLGVFLSIIVLASFARFYKINTNPPGLYWDEAVFGYDAYSLLKTGKDHHGIEFPLFFESFGDWKLPVYHYLLVPSIKVFGLNEFAVRFPSALLGTLTVVVFYLLVKTLMLHSRSEVKVASRPHSESELLALFCAFFLAISPWHVQFSRGGFESTAGLFFVISGVYLFLLVVDSQKTKSSSVFFLPAIALASAGLFTLSMYAYHAYRLFTPIFAITLLVIYSKEIKKNLSKIFLPLALSLVILFPLLRFSFTPQGKARALSQSAFDGAAFETARIKFDQSSKKPFRFMSKYWSKPLYFSYVAFNNYIEHFSPIFLFIKGDQIGRHSQVDMGQIYGFEAILLAISLFAIKKLNPSSRKIMIAWLVLSPIPAMIVTPTPHAYRTLQMSVPLAFFAGLGAYWLFTHKSLVPLKFLLILIAAYSFLSYLHLLFIHYPKKFAADWQDGYRQMVAQVMKFQDQFDKIYITNINQVPYIYLLFYGKYDPGKFIAEGGTRDSFSKYVFISDEVNIYDKALPAGRQGRILYVAPSWKKVDGIWLAAANDSVGRHIYSLWEVNGKN